MPKLRTREVAGHIRRRQQFLEEAALRAGRVGALDGTVYRGGRTTINGVENDDVQQSTRRGGTLT